ncbi:hypothetical protein METUNv1_00510 [Methyloversatilis universalis FAM5]|uniref:ASCH domain-containing protein n=1 Tax=Methyloversatilis universalis (strain ATCC BAA-1314 / DSM 25237 / JCM 13912 / CCUG 52030 / FAM5) TaxID=1000565 RepID=F5R874_METUF|nr:hypothetical protein [Methyloversatilis universalis]EGK73332.1 hypothetical protein METUNv1_00510 [Methyloversatilis universalis FAM5]
MKERPMLMSAPMVRAILAGTKTQTRRVVKPQPQMVTDRTIKPWDGDADALLSLLTKTGKSCPYGQPGDRLWVREAFCDARKALLGRVLYRASGDVACGWQPSIHMPRCASRITLEVTAVRVERLQDISIEDAKAEGAWPDSSVVGRCMAYFGIDALAVNPRLAFRMVWEQINGPGSWDANPWVWVVEFKRVTP